MQHSSLRPSIFPLVLFLLAAPDASTNGGGPCEAAHAPHSTDALQENRVRTGTVRFVPGERETAVPDPYRMQEHEFSFREVFVGRGEEVQLSFVEFPSPVVTPYAENNTVCCEYYRPSGDGPYPSVVVLHILGGDFALSRLFCGILADGGVGALFVKMPYYGERRPAEADVEMVSADIPQTVAAMQQAVLDIRRAVAWLAAQPEVDGSQLGIMGVSLGGIMSALAAEAEPNLRNVAIYLGGGNGARAMWESEELREVRRRWEDAGGTLESLTEALAPVDPITWADNLRDRRVFMVAARYDEVVPPECAEALWEAAGRPEIVWCDCGHYTAARYLIPILARTTQFFAGENPEVDQHSTNPCDAALR